MKDTLEISPEEWEGGLGVARSQRVAVFVVAYNAESHIGDTLRRIPEELRALLVSIYVIDDHSSDATSAVARGALGEIAGLRVFATPYNQGYGGNQKLGYRHAIREGFDVVVLLHGDGQYAPEALPRLLAPFADPQISAVFGSRMMTRGTALRGGMPLYKYVGNRALTAIENRLLGTELSEFHSGYRAYRMSALSKLPFRHNTNDFHFDTEIIVQLVAKRMRIVEVPIPTYYGAEICHVEGVPYAIRCVSTVLRSRLNRLHLVHHPKFDLFSDEGYVFKEAPTTVHQHVLRLPHSPGSRVLELGAGHGGVGRALHEAGATVVAVDRKRPTASFPYRYLEMNLDDVFAEEVIDALAGRADRVIALDVIEHLRDPERSLTEIHRVLAVGGTLTASTGNVAYFLVRLMLALGHFNYGKKGILDLTHTRLFTLRSFCRSLEGAGFRIERVRGFGPPIVDMVGSSLPLRVADRLAAFLARIWPRLFAYQIVVQATRLDDVEDILDSTLASGSTPGT